MAQKVLLVDDEEELCELMSESLGDEGYECFSAFSGKQGYEVFLKESPDIVITDLNMPGGNGLELAQKIKKDSPNIPVGLFLSGIGEISPEEVYEIGICRILSKPIRSDALAQVIEQMLSFLPSQWLEGDGKADQELKANFSSVTQAISEKKFALGRGGFSLFLEETPSFSQKKPLSFQIRFDEGGSPLEGVGEIAWNKQVDSSVKVGIEIRFLSSQSKPWIEKTKDPSLVSWIPLL